MCMPILYKNGKKDCGFHYVVIVFITQYLIGNGLWLQMPVAHF